MHWLRRVQEHVGLALVAATFWLLATIVAYFVWVIWGGWGIEKDLALAQVLAPVAGLGFAAIVVIAAVLAFLPPRARLSYSVEIDPQSGREQFTIANSGPVPAADVAIMIVVVPADDLWTVARYWPVAELSEHHSTTIHDTVIRKTILRRAGSLSSGATEIVLSNLSGNIETVCVTASNADEVCYYPRRRDRDGAPSM